MQATRRRLSFFNVNVLPAVSCVPQGHFVAGTFTKDTPPDLRTTKRCVVASSPSDELQLMNVASIETAREALDIACRAARDAFRASWRVVTDEQRAEWLTAVASKLHERRHDLARVEALCSGMCISDAKASVDGSIDVFRKFAAVSMLPVGDVLPPFGEQGTTRARTVREPVGVVGLITPFNYPLEMGAWKIAPALAAGNAVVWKPPELAPLSAQLFAECVSDAGLPSGLVNVVHGDGELGEALVRHDEVDLVGFTGSTSVGRRIQIAAAESGLKRCNLELGGNAPVVVCRDFPMDTAASIAMACFGNNGQSCTSARRIFVHRDGLTAFLKALVPKIKQRRLGHALDPNVDQGPVISGQSMQRILEAVRQAEFRGASLVCGGDRAIFPTGYFVPPTVVTNIPADDPLVTEELFGPVMVVRTYDALQEVVEECTASRYGLSANVLSKDVDVVRALTDALPAGTVWVNGADVMNATTPFGGTRQSGYGKDLGVASLASYSNTKTIIEVGLHMNAQALLHQT